MRPTASGIVMHALLAGSLTAACAPIGDSETGDDGVGRPDEGHASDARHRGPGDKSATFPDDPQFRCTPAQQQTIEGDIPLALEIMDSGLEQLTRMQRSGKKKLLFKNWFGPYAAAKADQVRSRLEKLRSSLAGDYPFGCDPNEPVWGWAWVGYPGIWLGGPYFRPGAKADDRATALIHELSHAELSTRHCKPGLDCAESWEGFTWRAWKQAGH